MTLDQQIAQAEAQLEIYEIEHYNSTSHQYSAAIESLYIEALQQYGALLARRQAAAANTRAAWLAHPGSARFW